MPDDNANTCPDCREGYELHEVRCPFPPELDSHTTSVIISALEHLKVNLEGINGSGGWHASGDKDSSHSASKDMVMAALESNCACTFCIDSEYFDEFIDGVVKVIDFAVEAHFKKSDTYEMEQILREAAGGGAIPSADVDTPPQL